MAVNAENKIKLIVVTPYKTFFEDKADIVVVPSIDGELGVMCGHSPLVVALKPGICKIITGDETLHFSCSEGYAEIGHKVALVVCNSAEWPEEINVNRIVNSYLDGKAKMKQDEMLKREQKAIITSDNRNLYERAKARMHLVEIAGTDAEKNKLIQLKKDLGID